MESDSYLEDVVGGTEVRAASAMRDNRAIIEYRNDARCNRCGAKVDPMEGVVAKVEIRGELARLWHVECYGRTLRQW